MTPLTGGSYRSANAGTKCAERVEVTLKSTGRNGQYDIDVKLASGGVSPLQQWPGQPSARNAAGAELRSDLTRDSWVIFDDGKSSCLYRPENPPR